MWYVIQVLSGQEDKACELINLHAAGQRSKDGRPVLKECFVPRYEVQKQFRGQWRTCTATLFPGYLIVVTDRVVLDKQIRDTIRQFAQVGKIVAWAESSGDLRKAIEDGRRIIITTIEKFPYVLPEIGEDHKNRHFAILIDEAHSSQNGKTAGSMNMTLSAIMADPDMDNEDKINAMCEGKKLLTNASYFAFTATPKNKTLETFGTLVVDAYGNPVLNEKGEVQHRPFHVYTMKQAIEEGFILDVLKYYTPIDSYYRLKKIVEDDPMFDKKKAQKKLRAFVESQSFTIAEKADMMVSHFHEQVIAKGKIGGQARAMIITSSIARCIDYYHAVNQCLANRRSPYKAIIAFSGEKQLDNDQPPVTSAGLNGFADAAIPKTFKKDPYRFLIVADMFQTGYDEPLLHTMIVDKKLRDVKAVQTLSRLNRTYPGKEDTYILDFVNTKEEILEAFQPYYQETSLTEEINVDLIYKTQKQLREFKLYNDSDIETVTKIYFSPDAKKVGSVQAKISNALLPVAKAYNQLSKEDRYQFRRLIRAFVKWYNYISQIVRMFDKDLHKEFLFCSYLSKLIPAEPSTPWDLENRVKLEYYRLEKTFEGAITLEDKATALEPAKTKKAVNMNAKKDPLDEVIDRINETYKGDFTEADRVLIGTLREKLLADKKLRKAAKVDGQQIFEKNVFPKIFDQTAQASYIESTETYTKLFEDTAKYKAIMVALAKELYRELRNG